MADRHVPVLVVGGSLVGLSTSALLASKGVPHIVIERHRGTAIHPRAALFHQGTIEVFRSLGLEAAVEEAAAREFVQNGAILSVPALTSQEPKYFFPTMNVGVEHMSATRRLFITQIGLEPILHEYAVAHGAEHLYGTELVRFEQDADGVTAVVRGRDDGAEQTIRADYMVAADGAHSPVRERLGIKTLGRGTFANCVTIYFKADLRDLLQDRNWSVVYVNHPEMLGFSRYSIGQDGGFLVVFSTLNDDGTWNRDVSDMDEATCIEMVRKSLGVPDREVTVEFVQKWQAASGHSEQFRDGRIFLAGDSAHVMPPTGGFGGNTGVADAFNLAWKLAMVVHGVASPALLDTYDPERRPVGDLTAEQAYTRYVLRVDPSLKTDDLAPTMDDASIELGPVYRSAAVVDADDDPAPLYNPAVPGGRIGARAPHIPVSIDGKRGSIHDLFGQGFVLLAGPEGEAWCDAAADVAGSLGLPLAAHRVASDAAVADEAGGFAEAYGIEPGGAVIVRPDAVLAWRATEAVEDPREAIRRAVLRLLMKSESATPPAVVA